MKMYVSLLKLTYLKGNFSKIFPYYGKRVENKTWVWKKKYSKNLVNYESIRMVFTVLHAPKEALINSGLEMPSTVAKY